MKRTVGLQLFRKLVQISVIGFVVYTALGAHWRNFKEAHNSVRITRLMTNEFWAELYWRNEQFLRLFGDDTLTTSETTLGGPWAATVGGIPMIDPLAVVAVMVSGTMPPTAMLLGALTPIVLALLLGRVFCSFLCPARLIFEIGNLARRGLIWLGVPLPEVEVPRLGLWVAAGSILFAASAGPGVFWFVLPYLSFGSALFGYVLGGAVLVTAWWFAAVVLIDLLIAPGQFCHAICPTGAILEQIGRAKALAVVRTPAACPPSCDVCQRACPYGLFPGNQTHQPACDGCGRCTVACPQNKLSHALKVPWKQAALVVLAVGLLFSGRALAHHNKGLPHYGYFENYPQVPTEEFIDEVGRWEVGTVLFNFQGMKRVTSDTPNDVRFFAYVYDLERDRGYKGPLTLHIALDGEPVASHARAEGDTEGVYIIRQEMPASGWYDVTFEFEVDGQVQSVPLEVRIDLAADRINWGILGGAGLLFLIVFSLALAGRKARAVRRAPAVQES